MTITPDGIRFFQLLSVRGRLQIEVRTGLRSQVSSLAAARRIFGCVSNTKKGALAEIEAMIAGAQDQKHGIEARKRYPGSDREAAAYVRGYRLNARTQEVR